MKVRLPRLVQDPLVAEREGLRIERFEVQADSKPGDEILLDGPVCERVAVVDFDARTGELVPGARLIPPDPGKVLGRYDVDEGDPHSPALNQVSVFATVLLTLRMFEEPDALGRRLTWAFDAPQLLVVPRAGERARAFYQRESHSLQFFFFPSQRREHGGRVVYSSLSQDIVSHETAHAILDGIAPDLYHASTPQSLGLHEAIADLTALLMAFRSRELAVTVLEKTGGSIHDSQLFSSLAEEYAQGKDRLGRVGFLRSLDNRKTLDQADDSLDEHGAPNRVDRGSPHQLCQVLTGALYPLVLAFFKDRQKMEMERTGRSAFSVSGRALAIAANRFKRMLLRALDYLPPGEVSFADYGRAILASDQASHPKDDDARLLLRKEFVRRHIVQSEDELVVETDFEHAAIFDLDLETLVASDWVAHDFVSRHRDLFGIPPEIHFEVRPRLDVTKTYYHREGPRSVRECLLKVSWETEEDNEATGAGRLPSRRRITVGTTLAIDWETRKIRALLTSDRGDDQRRDRDAMLARMLDESELDDGELDDDELDDDELDDGALDDEPQPVREGLGVETAGGHLRLRASASRLHGFRRRGTAGRVTGAKARKDPPRLIPPHGVDAGAFFNLVRWRRRRR